MFNSNLAAIKKRLTNLEKKAKPQTENIGILFFNSKESKWLLAGKDTSFKNKAAAINHFDKTHSKKAVLIIDDIPAKLNETR